MDPLASKPCSIANNKRPASPVGADIPDDKRIKVETSAQSALAATEHAAEAPAKIKLELKVRTTELKNLFGSLLAQEYSLCELEEGKFQYQNPAKHHEALEKLQRFIEENGHLLRRYEEMAKAMPIGPNLLHFKGWNTLLSIALRETPLLIETDKMARMFFTCCDTDWLAVEHKITAFRQVDGNYIEDRFLSFYVYLITSLQHPLIDQCDLKREFESLLKPFIVHPFKIQFSEQLSLSNCNLFNLQVLASLAKGEPFSEFDRIKTGDIPLFLAPILEVQGQDCNVIPPFQLALSKNAISPKGPSPILHSLSDYIFGILIQDYLERRTLNPDESIETKKIVLEVLCELIRKYKDNGLTLRCPSIFEVKDVLLEDYRQCFPTKPPYMNLNTLFSPEPNFDFFPVTFRDYMEGLQQFAAGKSQMEGTHASLASPLQLASRNLKEAVLEVFGCPAEETLKAAAQRLLIASLSIDLVPEIESSPSSFQPIRQIGRVNFLEPFNLTIKKDGEELSLTIDLESSYYPITLAARAILTYPGNRAMAEACKELLLEAAKQKMPKALTPAFAAIGLNFDEALFQSAFTYKIRCGDLEYRANQTFKELYESSDAYQAICIALQGKPASPDQILKESDELLENPFDGLIDLPGLLSLSALELPRHSYDVSETIESAGPVIGIPNVTNSCFMNASIQALLGASAFRDVISSGTGSKKAHYNETKVLLKELIEALPMKEHAKIQAAATRLRDQIADSGINSDFKLKGTQQDAAAFLQIILKACGIKFTYAETQSGEAGGVIHNVTTEQRMYVLPIEISDAENKTALLETLIDKSMNELVDDPANAWKVTAGEKQYVMNKRTIKRRLVRDVPQVLTIQIKRFQSFANVETKRDESVLLPADDTIDMTPFFQLPDGHANPLKYRLVGCVNHKGGKSITSGHYIAYVLRDGQWYLASDNSLLKSVSPEEVEKNQAYILIFEKI